MKSFLSLVIGALITLCFASCSPLPPLPDGAEVVPLQQHPLYPLEVGRFWAYRAYNYTYRNPFGPGGPTYTWVDSSDFSQIIRRDTVAQHNNKFYRAVLFYKGTVPYWSDTNQVVAFPSLSITPETTYFQRFIKYMILKLSNYF